ISSKAQAEELAHLAHVADRVDAVEPGECAYACPPVGTWRENAVDAHDLLSGMEAHDTALLAAAARLELRSARMRPPTLRIALSTMKSRQGSRSRPKRAQPGSSSSGKRTPILGGMCEMRHRN